MKILKTILPKICFNLFGIDDLAGATILGGAISGIGSWFGGTSAAQASADAARKNTMQQIAWERERAMNAHQWEVQDLEKAGLNPILSAGGSGAATGSISPQMPDTTGINSAWAGASQALQNTVTNLVQNKATIASAKKASEEAKLASEKQLTEQVIRILENARARNISQDTANKVIEGLIKEEQRKQAQIDTDWKEPEKILDFSTKAVGPIIEILKSFGYFKLAKSLGKSKLNAPGYNNKPFGNYQQNNYYYR